MAGRSGSFSPATPSETSSSDNNSIEKSRKPDNTAFKQQRLPAWQPILTAQSVLPAFFVISVIFIPLGVALLLASNEVIEFSTDYTNCGNNECAELRNNASKMTIPCSCNVTLNVTKHMQTEVYVYYGLTNFFQNHRRYVKSRDDAQLNGQSVENSLSNDCSPYRNVNNTSSSPPIAPCGAIANSLFNDTFNFTLEGVTTPVGINLTGIAWPTDKGQKFNNPGDPNLSISQRFNGYAKPDFWQKAVYELDTNNPSNNGFENEGLIVWMRTAAFPTFRKPYGRIVDGLPKGVYTIQIDYNFPVQSFDGTKRIIVSTTSWIGGKNNFLGIAYIVVGSLCFAVGIALCIVHQITKKTTTGPR
ncbi:cell cycle control protein 50A-like [Styela clava]|uniref:cell cycle control protein 50A-like n=1 Tax=Styela clava TaxID=7725 RepID=UPI00193A390E|nr:cell cycle control protein 50A-like [Styela clava]